MSPGSQPWLVPLLAQKTQKTQKGKKGQCCKAAPKETSKCILFILNIKALDDNAGLIKSSLRAFQNFFQKDIVRFLFNGNIVQRKTYYSGVKKRALVEHCFLIASVPSESAGQKAIRGRERESEGAREMRRAEEAGQVWESFFATQRNKCMQLQLRACPHPLREQ